MPLVQCPLRPSLQQRKAATEPEAERRKKIKMLEGNEGRKGIKNAVPPQVKSTGQKQTEEEEAPVEPLQKQAEQERVRRAEKPLDQRPS